MVYNCDICFKTMQNKSNLHRHKTNKHPNSEGGDLHSKEEESVGDLESVLHKDNSNTEIKMNSGDNKLVNSSIQPIKEERELSKSDTISIKDEKDKEYSKGVERNGKLFECTFCNFSYNNKIALRRHTRNAHNIYARNRKMITTLHKVESMNQLKPINNQEVREEIIQTTKRYRIVGKIVYDLVEDGEVMIYELKPEDRRALNIYTSNKNREENLKYSIVDTHYGDSDENNTY